MRMYNSDSINCNQGNAMLELNLDKPFILLTGEELKPDHICKFVANEVSANETGLHPLRIFKICIDLFNTGKASLEIKEIESLKIFIESLPISQNNILRTPFGKAQVLQLLNECLANSGKAE